VTASVTSGSATLFGTVTVATDASGIATFTNLGLSGTIGTYTLTFSSGSLTSAVSNSIDLAAGAAAQLQIVQQPSGVPLGGGTFSTQPVIQLLDAQNNTVSQAGTNVTATENVSVGSCNLTGAKTIPTNASGVAGYANLGINSAPCTFTITFSATGLTSATSSQIAASFFDLSFEPDSAVAAGVEGHITSLTAVSVPAMSPGTHPVAPDTLSLTTFSGGAESTNGSMRPVIMNTSGNRPHPVNPHP
jgi:hypothetical protein